MKTSYPKYLVIITIILMDILSGMEFDLFVPSFPELQNFFNLSPFQVEASLSVNFAGYCLGLLFVGGLADRYGRKPIILLGLLTFVSGNLLCLNATAYHSLLIGRSLQGVGISAPAILSFLIIADTYSLKQQQFLMAILNGAMNAAVAVAPVIGSYITLYFHWRSNFMALLCLGMITLVMTLLFIPAYPLPQQKATLAHSSYFIIFRSKPLRLLILGILFILVPYWIFVGISPLLYIKDLGVSLSHFGYYQGSLALVFALGSLIYGLIIKHKDYSQKKMLYFSMQVFVLSIIMLALVTALNSTNPLFIIFAVLLFTIGQIIPSAILYPLCLNLMPEAKGRVAASIQAGRLIFAAMGLQIAGYIYQGSFQSIGILMIGFVLVAIIKLYAVTKNRELMEILDK